MRPESEGLAEAGVLMVGVYTKRLVERKGNGETILGKCLERLGVNDWLTLPFYLRWCWGQGIYCKEILIFELNGFWVVRT